MVSEVYLTPRFVADSSRVGENRVARAWTIKADDIYCGPTAAFGKSGSNANAYAWIKVRRSKSSRKRFV